MVAPDASPPRAAGAGGQARGASILETSDAMDQACELIMGRYREDGGEGGAAVRAKLLDLYRRASAEAGRVRAKEGEERLRRAAPPPSPVPHMRGGNPRKRGGLGIVPSRGSGGGVGKEPKRQRSGGSAGSGAGADATDQRSPGKGAAAAAEGPAGAPAPPASALSFLAALNRNGGAPLPAPPIHRATPPRPPSRSLPRPSQPTRPTITSLLHPPVAWVCSYCGSSNPPSRARCGKPCFRWRGGKHPQRKRLPAPPAAGTKGAADGDKDGKEEGAKEAAAETTGSAAAPRPRFEVGEDVAVQREDGTRHEAIVKEIVEGGGGGSAGSGVTYSVEFSDGVLADGVPADRISDLGEAQVADSANGVRSNHDGTSG